MVSRGGFVDQGLPLEQVTPPIVHVFALFYFDDYCHPAATAKNVVLFFSGMECALVSFFSLFWI
jgi:hypothetical protein